MLRVCDLPKPLPYRPLPSGGFLCPTQPLLLCRSCGDEWSANPKDYWAADPTQPLRCGRCETPLELVRKEQRYVRVKVKRGRV